MSYIERRGMNQGSIRLCADEAFRNTLASASFAFEPLALPKKKKIRGSAEDKTLHFYSPSQRTNPHIVLDDIGKVCHNFSRIEDLLEYMDDYCELGILQTDYYKK